MIETGVLFNNIHSFYDLDLILSAVEVPPAIPKMVYVDIPGADGSLDLTEAHGEVKYNDRTISMMFLLNPAGDLSEFAWECKKTQVCNALNGVACRLVLDKDPDYYWVGRCEIDRYASNKRLRQIVVNARVRPYKYKHKETVETFALTTAGQTVVLRNSRKSVCPVITCTNSNTKVTFNGSTYTLGAGTHQTMDIRLVEGENKVTISGSGSITFAYQEGDL